MLQFYNTLSRKLESFKPLHNNSVGLYTCGPTVYNAPHIGNWRAFLWEDVLRRYLEYKGFHVVHIMNLTDVDDKTIKGSREKGVSLDEFTKPFKKTFFAESALLNIKPATHFTEATKHIPAMVSLIKKLLKNGFAYRAEDGSIYFAIKKFKAYGKLSKFKLKKLKSGARVSQDEYEKQTASDFALWKAWSLEDGNAFWETELGKGRPGWHIECSAMSMQYLGETFDIHTGGIDNLFPHHENEIAQSEAATGKPFVKYWLHGGHLLVNGQKMSKSLGNFFRLPDLRQFEPKTIRFALIANHYRKPADFSLSEAEKAGQRLEKINDCIQRLLEFALRSVDIRAAPDPQADKAALDSIKIFESGMDADLNVPKALLGLNNLVKRSNAWLESGKMNVNRARILLEAFKKIDSVLGIISFEPKKMEKLGSEIESLIQKREELRKQKKWVEADAIRKQLSEKGIELMDTPQGVKWKKTG